MATIQTLTTLPEDWDDTVLTRAQAEALLAQPHHVLFVAITQSNNELRKPNDGQGHLLARLVPHTQADILTLYVPPAHRRHGHARQLVEAVLTEARKRACTGLTLEVEATNAAAIKLYTSCGLQQVALRAGYYRNPVSNLKADALVLAVPLT